MTNCRNFPLSKIHKQKVVINTEQAILVEADGIIIPNAHNCKVSIYPEAIQMIVP